MGLIPISFFSNEKNIFSRMFYVFYNKLLIITDDFNEQSKINVIFITSNNIIDYEYLLLLIIAY